ncbi:MAG: hypothetical protein Q8M02_13940 [Candidatus Didemnitutus sp.]|nr:hypothetical protein [Candidatus Didemnitutus sp.]
MDARLLLYAAGKPFRDDADALPAPSMFPDVTVPSDVRQFNLSQRKPTMIESRLVILLLAAALHLPLITAKTGSVQGESAFNYECDDACLLPGAPVPAGKYAVVSPVGPQTVKMITQAPRLDSMNGKTIAVVGGSFMAKITHPEIKRLILANYPTAKVILLNEIGSAGPYPGPGITRQAKDEFQKKLKEMGVNAVISGNGGCGLCTPKETGSSIAAEYIGIPAVTIAAPTFVNQVYSTAGIQK